jgi:hypothetical protein
MAMVIGAASLSGLVVLLLIVFNVSKREISKASYPGIQVINAEVFQIADSVLRGSINSPIVGLSVEVKGYTTPVKLNSITFSLKGTSKPYNKQIENIKIWSSGSEKSFSNTIQLYQSVSPGEGNIRIDLNKMLNSGNNYFWITADILPTAVPSATIDAEISTLTVGGMATLPLISSPPGNKKIRNNQVVFSTKSGNAQDVSCWNMQRNGNGNIPEKTGAENTCYIIQKGHDITINRSQKMPIVLVEEGGKLTCSDTYTIDELQVNQSGTVLINSSDSNERNINNLILNDGANLIFNSTGPFISANTTLAKTSNTVFMNYGAESFGDNIIWGNVLFDAPSGGSANIGSGFRSVRGNFEIKNTGQGTLYTEGVSIMTIKGNFTLSGGNFDGVRHVNSKLVLNVGGNFIVHGGTLKDVENSTTASARSTFNIYGDVMLLGGQILLGHADDDGSFINLIGIENPQIRWIQSDKAQVELCNIALKPEKEMILKGNKLGDIVKGCQFIVERNAKLWCGNFSITGKGKFNLADRATIGIGHPKGINSLKNEGNILTQERQFNSGANYIYYSATAPQETGSFNTSPKDGAIRNLTVKKDHPSQTVNLSQDLYVSEQVKISMGDLNRGSFKLQLSDVSESSVKAN